MILIRERQARRTGKRFPIMVGYAQLQALKLLCKLPPAGQPKDGTITSRGVLRDHTFSDLVPAGLATCQPLGDGRVKYLPTALGRRAVKEARVAKVPARGKARAPRGSLVARGRANGRGEGHRLSA